MVKNMKYALEYCLASIVAVSLSGCMREQEYPDARPQNNLPCRHIEVSMADGSEVPPGKTLTGWVPVGLGKSYEYQNVDGEGSHEFEYSGEGEAPSQVAYAVYAASAADSLYRGTFYLPIKPVQDIADGDYDSSAMSYAGHLDGAAVSLYPLTGKIGFVVNQDDVAVCRISTGEDNALAGQVRVQMLSRPSVKPHEKSAKSVELRGKFEKGKTYYAVVAAEDFSILDVEFENSYGVKVYGSTYTGYYPLSEGGTVSLGKVGDPDVSSLEMTVSTTEYEGYCLKSVVGYSAEDGTKIMGTEVGEVFGKDRPLKVRFFGLKPKDYSSDKLWYVFTLEKDGVGRVLPIETQGLNITPSTAVRYDIGELAESRNAAPWYYPYEDRRLMSGAGYAYGDANTYLIQFKDNTYDGATLDPDPSIPSSVTIDYRLRGDMFSSPRPDNVTFEWLQGYNNSSPAWGRYTMDRTQIWNCDKYSISVDAENYKVTVTNTGAHVGAPILLMKKEGKVLWAWTFWNVAADGTRLEAVKFGDVGLANMAIGHASTQKDAILGKLTELRRSTCYYQWGRPIPTFSQNGTGVYFSETDGRNASKPRVPVCDKGALSVEEALQNPGYLIQNTFTPGTMSPILNDWNSGGMGNDSDLWGGTGETSEGVKSIYDPCPKGWRVADAKTYMSLFPKPAVGYSKADYPQDVTAGYNGVSVNGVLFICSGYYSPRTSADKYVENYGVSYGTNRTAANLYWTNAFHSGTKAWSFGADYFYKKYDGAVENTSREIGVRDMSVGNALPVRCQVDKENR